MAENRYGIVIGRLADIGRSERMQYFLQEMIFGNPVPSEVEIACGGELSGRELRLVIEPAQRGSVAALQDLCGFFVRVEGAATASDSTDEHFKPTRICPQQRYWQGIVPNGESAVAGAVAPARGPATADLETSPISGSALTLSAAESLILRLNSATVFLDKKFPPDLVVTAEGIVGSAGWRAPTLALVSKGLGSDGCYEFEFRATPPAPGSSEAAVICPVGADYVCPDVGAECQGVRIRTIEQDQGVQVLLKDGAWNYGGPSR